MDPGAGWNGGHYPGGNFQGHAPHGNHSSGQYSHQSGAYDTMYTEPVAGGVVGYGQQAAAPLAGGMPRVPAPPANLVFFTAACCIMAGSFFSAIVMFFSGSIVDFLNLSYIFMFGSLLAILDTPFLKQIKACKNLEKFISKYTNVLTRVTGKGFCFVFLGCALLSAMFANLQNVVTLVFAFIFNVFVIFVGLVAIVIGWLKSRRLDNVRLKLREQGGLKMISDHALTWPESSGAQAGLTPSEFNRLTQTITTWSWDEWDLRLIFDAIHGCKIYDRQGNSANSPPPREKLSFQEIKEWVNGDVVLL